MNPTPDEKLDALLQQWKNQPDDTSRLDDLSDRIVSAAMTSAVSEARGVRLVREGSIEKTARTASPAPLSRFVIGLVAAAVAVVIIAVSSHNIKTAPTGSDSVPEYARFSREQVSEKALLLGEMNEVFDNRLVWMAETSNDLDFGLRQVNKIDVARTVNDGIAVRIVVQRRSVGSSDWQQFWAMDVVSRYEEFVTVSPQKDAGQQLQLWTYRLPDGAIAVECSLQLNGDDSLLAESSELHRDSKPQQVATTRDHETEYRVFQSVAVLNREVI